MVAYSKYDVFVKNLIDKVHSFASATDVFKIALTNRTPVAATDALRATAVELSTANGYTSGGVTITMSTTQTGAVSNAIAADPAVPTWTGTTTSPAFTFSHVFLYNDTPAAPLDPLIAYWAYGSSQAVNNGETLTVDFGATLYTIT